MFSRLKDAFERSVAEEQARHKVATESKAASAAPSEPAAPPSTAQAADKEGQSAPDPAVFEELLKQAHDADARSGSATPGPTPSTTDKKTSTPRESDGSGKPATSTPPSSGTVPADPASPASSASSTADLPPHIRLRLKKLEKMEASYPDLLRSYRIAHMRIEPFERALKENTPLNSIKDPAALVEYLSQVKLQSDIAVQERNRVSSERDDMKKKLDQVEKESVNLRDEISALKAIKKDEAAPGVRPKQGDEGEDMFSYDDEIPRLQAEVVFNKEKIASLTSELATLKDKSGITTLPPIKNLTSNLPDITTLETRDVAVQVQGLGRLDLIAHAAEFSSIKAELEYKGKQLAETETRLKRERSTYASSLAEKKSEIEKMSIRIEEGETARMQLAKRVSELSAVMTIKAEGSQEAKESVEVSAEEDESCSTLTEATEDSMPSPSTPSMAASANKKKNKKKKKGHATETRPPLGTANLPQPSPPEGTAPIKALKAEVLELKDVIAEKDLRIGRLSEELMAKEHYAEEIEHLRENIIEIGHAHVNSQKRIKELEEEKKSLDSRVSEQEQEISLFEDILKAKAQLEAGQHAANEQLEEMSSHIETLKTDLGVAQKVSQDRYKEMTKMKDYLGKIRTEMTRLRGDSDNLKLIGEEVRLVKGELEAGEKREKELSNQLRRSTDLCSEHKSKIQMLSEQLSTEKTSHMKQKTNNQTLLRNLQQLETEKAAEVTKSTELGLELEKLQSQQSNLRPKVKELEDEVAKLQKEKNLAKEDLDLKTQQYNNAQGLIASMRDANTELKTRQKEMENQVESLKEDLEEAQRLLDNRTRDGETMRRMLADTNMQADVKVRDMRAQLEKATEERDRIEDESSSLARNHSREIEGLRNKTRQLEHDIKTLTDEKGELEAKEKEWVRRLEELEPNERKTAAEMQDLRSAVSGLRTALDASEQQVLDVEKQKADLKRLLKEARDRDERMNKELKELKELKSAHSRLHVGSGPDASSSGTNTVDSSRRSIAGSKGTPATVDPTYLRNVFFSFLESKDESMRAQCIGVLGRVLGVDKSGEQQRWLKACQHIQKPR